MDWQASPPGLRRTSGGGEKGRDAVRASARCLHKRSGADLRVVCTGHSRKLFSHSFENAATACPTTRPTGR